MTFDHLSRSDHKLPELFIKPCKHSPTQIGAFCHWSADAKFEILSTQRRNGQMDEPHG
ncbi:hypothetical protein AO385_0671 [Moraxella catarrhalis]|nr:hypothetical protein AO385_0671 [Moraxella catarrhalis]